MKVEGLEPLVVWRRVDANCFCRRCQVSLPRVNLFLTMQLLLTCLDLHSLYNTEAAV